MTTFSQHAIVQSEAIINFSLRVEAQPNRGIYVTLAAPPMNFPVAGVSLRVAFLLIADRFPLHIYSPELSMRKGRPPLPVATSVPVDLFLVTSHRRHPLHPLRVHPQGP